MLLYNEDDDDDNDENESEDGSIDNDKYPADPNYPPDSEQIYAAIVFPHIPF